MDKTDPPTADPTASLEYSTWELIRRMLRLTWRYRAGCVKVIVYQGVLLTMAMSGLAMIGVGVDYIDYTYGQAAPPRWPLGLSPPGDWGFYPTLSVIAGAVLGLGLTRAVVNYLYTVNVAKLVQGRVVPDLRRMVYDKLQRLSFRFFDANASGSIINRVTADVQSVRAFVDQVVVQTLILVLSLAIYLVYMLSIHVPLTLACLATTPLLWWLTTWFSRVVKPAFMRSRELADHMVLAMSENIQGVHVIKGFARQQEEVDKFAGRNRDVREQKRWIFWRISFFQPAIGMLVQINLVVLIAYGGYLAIVARTSPEPAAGISIGQLVVFAGLLQQFSGQVNAVAQIANMMQQSLTGARRVFQVLDAPVDIQSPDHPAASGRAGGKVTFDRVSFAYQAADPVLEEVSFQAAPGECVAILGATGAGKSTLLSLIPRFYDPHQGRVMVDDIDLRQWHLDDLRRNIGIVFQESFLFSNTIAANIAFGHPDASREQIIEAARIAAAHDFITDMPDGYETIIAESGANLSGGQRQRLAIARAVLLNPAILLLDDPTAAIDPETENEILQAMDRAMEGRTTFVVAHRLSTLRRADKVVVLEQGRIKEIGTHAQLMGSGGDYRRAADLQAADNESRQLLGFEPRQADETQPGDEGGDAR